MDISTLYNRYAESSTLVKILLITIGLLSTFIVALGVAGGVLLFDPSWQAANLFSAADNPLITLEPFAGSVGSTVTVSGENWPANQQVLIYVMADDTQPPNVAIASGLINAAGTFSLDFIVPSESNLGMATVLAQSDTATARALLNIGAAPDWGTGPRTTATPEPTNPLPTIPPLPTPFLVSVNTMNVRSGPGLEYRILGLLSGNQPATIRGQSPDGAWWLIDYPIAADGIGWIFGEGVRSENLTRDNVPVVGVGVAVETIAPTPTSTLVGVFFPTFTPTPTPTGTPTPPPTSAPVEAWAGQYWDNAILAGEPRLVRRDSAINFQWGDRSPAAGIPVDSFSVRWHRWLTFDRGLYRFHVWVDDGLRLYIDGNLVINEWRDTGGQFYTAEVALDGAHWLEVEYYDHSGAADIDLWWERLSNVAPLSPPTATVEIAPELDDGFSKSVDATPTPERERQYLMPSN